MMPGEVQPAQLEGPRVQRPEVVSPITPERDLAARLGRRCVVRHPNAVAGAIEVRCALVDAVVHISDTHERRLLSLGLALKPVLAVPLECVVAVLQVAVDTLRPRLSFNGGVDSHRAQARWKRAPRQRHLQCPIRLEAWRTVARVRQREGSSESVEHALDDRCRISLRPRQIRLRAGARS